MIEPVEWAYLAGLIDGDGSITLITGRQKWSSSPRVTIANIDKKLLKMIKKIFGGKLIPVRKIPRNKNWKYGWMLYWTNGDNCSYILENILPYLKKKNRQAEICLEVSKTMGIYKGCKGLPLELRVRRLELLEEIRSINRRGIDN
jgi:intein/homing endonuclease